MQAVADHVSGLSAGEVAARKARGEVNAPPPPTGRSYRQIVLGAAVKARDVLGEAAFEEVRERGRGMGFEQAIAYALS